MTLSIRRLLLAALLPVLAVSAAHADNFSQWVHPGPDGKLSYQTTPAGDRILDFSYAGYMGGGVALPDVPAMVTLSPSDAPDDTARIQAAINQLAALPLVNGIRGAVLLGPGTFTCSNALVIGASGIVLRGSGTNATTIKMVGEPHRAIIIGEEGRRNERPPSDDAPVPGSDLVGHAPSPTSVHTTITDAYVPAGARTFSVADPSLFAVGNLISIRRPTTAAWVKFMGMDTLVRTGHHETWIGLSRGEIQERTVTAINGHQLTVDVPLADSYDATYLNPPGTMVAEEKAAPRVAQSGIEHLRIACPPLEIDYGHAPYSAIRVGGDDCWVCDVFCEETMNSTVLAGRRITLEQVVVYHTYPNLGASKPSDFSLEGSQVLIDRCEDTGDNTYCVWCSGLIPGPNVVLNSTFRGRGSRIQPHQRWSTGLLVDNCTVPDGGIDFANRGVAGSGHGWTMGWAVAWNCVASTYVIQQPPGTYNWAIGCLGERIKTARYFDTTPILSEGVFESHGTPVAPQSLYLAQLQDRLGPQSLRNLGYASDSADEFSNKSVPQFPAFHGPHTAPGENLAWHRPVNVNSVRNGSRAFEGEKAVDGDPATYWAVNDNVKTATLEVDMEGPVDLNTVVLSEPAGMTGRVQGYRVEGLVDSDWKLLSQGTAIGAHQVDRFPTATVWKVRLTIFQSQGFPAISELGLYSK